MGDQPMAGLNLAGQVEGLTVSFAGREVLRGVDLEFPERSITAILGRSGTGKTTLLRALNRLNECFPDCVTRGRVRLRLAGTWHETSGPGALPLTDLRRRVGMVFQTPNVLPVSIQRNMFLPLQLVCGADRQEAARRMEGALKEVLLWDEVKDRLDRPALSLSGGQQQRLCLARALALEPELLLLDEPTASVDCVAVAGIEALLLQLKQRYTLVLVSHSLAQTRRLADRVAVLRDGRVLRVFENDEQHAQGALESCLEDTL